MIDSIETPIEDPNTPDVLHFFMETLARIDPFNGLHVACPGLSYRSMTSTGPGDVTGGYYNIRDIFDCLRSSEWLEPGKVGDDYVIYPGAWRIGILHGDIGTKKDDPPIIRIKGECSDLFGEITIFNANSINKVFTIEYLAIGRDFHDQ